MRRRQLEGPWAQETGGRPILVLRGMRVKVGGARVTLGLRLYLAAGRSRGMSQR